MRPGLRDSCEPPACRVRNASAASPHVGGVTTCPTGFVWREAFEGDLVWVTPQRRADVKDENERQLQRVAQ